MVRLIDFPILTMLAAIAIGIPSIYFDSQAGLGLAAGLTTAAGTAYQYQQKYDDDPAE